MKLANDETGALRNYKSLEELISDVYNSGLAGIVFKDDNTCALKQANGLGWYHITEPLMVEQLRWIGVRTFWRYDGSISVLTNGIRRVALRISSERWHVGSSVDTHHGPEVHVRCGSIGEGHANELKVVV